MTRATAAPLESEMKNEELKTSMSGNVEYNLCPVHSFICTFLLVFFCFVCFVNVKFCLCCRDFQPAGGHQKQSTCPPDAHAGESVHLPSHSQR